MKTNPATAFQHSSLCVVGNINRDIKVPAVSPDESLFRDGENSVSAITETIGGGGANSAFTARAFGAQVAFLGKVGADGLGRRLEQTIIRQGIATRLAKDNIHATGTSIALAFTNGQRHFLSCLPASRALTFDDLDLTVLAGHQHLLRADIWFSETMLKEGNLKLFQAARHAGLDLSIDLNWDPHWGHAKADEIRMRKECVRATLPWVNVVHGNVHELKEFTEAADLNGALKCLTGWGAEAVVVHMGDEGAGYYNGGALTVQPPAPVKSVVNTTGTGDVLSVCMMLLHRRAEIPIAERLRLANQIVAEFMEGHRQFIPTLED